MDALAMLHHIPSNSVEMSSTFLARCLVYVRLGDEEQAIEALKALEQANDYDGRVLPLIVKEAQDARMTRLATEALAALINVGWREEGDREAQVLVTIRSIVKLQIDAAERGSGFTMDTCPPFLSMLQQAFNEVRKSGGRDAANEQDADIATWLLKETYNVSHNDKHTITPALRLELCEVSLALFDARATFSKAMDDECYHVCLWLSLHILTAHLERAESVADGDVEEYDKVWTQIEERARISFDYAKTAAKHNSLGLTQVQSVETALDVILADSMTKLKKWDDLYEFLQRTRDTSSEEAMEAMASTVCDQKDAPQHLREAYILACLATFWDVEKSKPKDVHRVAEWAKRLIELYMELQQDGWEGSILHALQAVLKPIQGNEDVRRLWPRDSVQWMTSIAVSRRGGSHCRALFD